MQKLLGHWLPFSKDGCRALKDRGVKLIACTDGDRHAYAEKILLAARLANASGREFIFIEDTVQ